MRILITSCPTYGHFFPLIPISWALRSNGHELLAAMPGQFAEVANACGIQAVKLNNNNPFYSGRTSEVKTNSYKVWGSGTDGSHASRLTEAVIDHVIDAYVPISGTTVESVMEITKQWQPDLILHTPWEYSSQIAATAFGIPRVTHGWGAGLPADLGKAEEEALKPLLKTYAEADSLTPEALHIDICPPSMQFLSYQKNEMHMRYVPFNGAALSQPWHSQRGIRPRVVVSIGSVPIENGHAVLLEGIVKALSRMDVDAIVLTGGVRVSEQLNASNVRLVTENVPLANLMSACNLVIHHGGSGSTMTSTAYGLPQLAIPQMCDQFRHADRIAAAGCGLQLTNIRPSVEDIYLSIQELIMDERYSKRAQELRRENLSQVSPNQMVPYLEALALTARHRCRLAA